MRRTLIVFFILTLFLPRQGRSQSYTWKSLTNQSQVNDACAGDSRLWFATQGGLLAYLPTENAFLSLTNTEGLAGIQAATLMPEPGDTLWIGFSNGMIQRLNPDGSSDKLISVLEGYRVNDLVRQGDTLWVAHQLGISLYDLAKDEVRETYRQLGEDMERDEEVFELTVTGDTLWAGTAEGLCQASLSTINLLDPASWTHHTAASGLPHNKITSLAVFQNTLYAGTAGGLARRAGKGWQILTYGKINALLPYSERLYLAQDKNLRSWDGASLKNEYQANEDLSSLSSLQSHLYLTCEGGFYDFDPILETVDTLSYHGLGGALISAIAIDEDQTLWCTTRDGGFYSLNEDIWTGYTKDNSPDMKSNDMYSLLSDNRGRIWAGSWGGGIVRKEQNDSLTYFNSENGYLSGIPEDENYSVVTDMKEDGYGTVWILNYRAASNEPLTAVTPQDQWIYFGQADGISSGFLNCLTVDAAGRKWLGTQYSGIIIYDDRGTPADKTDDTWPQNITVSDGLFSNEITALALGSDGTMWIGTSKGINYSYGSGIEELYGLTSPVNSLLVDGAGNLWAGCDDGLYMFDSRNYSWSVFTRENSDILADGVTTLAMDYSRGFLYIGSNIGISTLATPYSAPSDTMGDIMVFPNPFITQSEGEAYIDNLAEDVEVTIFTASGYRVRHYNRDEIFGRRIVWDGRNEKGDFLASGIYLIVATNGEGATQKGKCTLIR